MELLVENLSRLNEAEESDRQGVFHILGQRVVRFLFELLLTLDAGIFENILGFNPSLATDLVSKTKILTWLLKRIESKQHDENRGYAAEILSILLQDNPPNRVEFGKQDGAEVSLKVLSVCRANSSPIACRLIIVLLPAIPSEGSSRCRRNRIHGERI